MIEHALFELLILSHFGGPGGYSVKQDSQGLLVELRFLAEEGAKYFRE
jgi:hypothetical protein